MALRINGHVFIIGALIATLSLPLSAQRAFWSDHKGYMDRFFLRKIEEVPGYKQHHRQLRRLLENDPNGEKLSEGMRIIRGKEDSISARLIASWVFQTKNPEAAVRRFELATVSANTIRRDNLAMRRLQNHTLTTVQLIAQRSVYVSELGVIYPLDSDWKKRHAVTLSIARRLASRFESWATMGGGDPIAGNAADWAISISNMGRLTSLPERLRARSDKPNPYVMQLALANSNERVVVKHPNGSEAIYPGFNGSLQFLPMWRQNPPRIGVALQVARLGQRHPSESWDAATFLMKQENLSPALLREMHASVEYSSNDWRRAGIPRANETVNAFIKRAEAASGILRR